jgi:hypothetical protein
MRGPIHVGGELVLVAAIAAVIMVEPPAPTTSRWPVSARGRETFVWKKK